MRTAFSFTCDPPSGLVRVVGALDLASRSQLHDILRVLRLRGCDQVQADLSEVTAVDASVFCLLDQERARLILTGGTFTIVATSDRFRRAAVLAGYGDVLPARADPSRGRPTLTAVPDAAPPRFPSDQHPA